LLLSAILRTPHIAGVEPAVGNQRGLPIPSVRWFWLPVAAQLEFGSLIQNSKPIGRAVNLVLTGPVLWPTRLPCAARWDWSGEQLSFGWRSLGS